MGVAGEKFQLGTVGALSLSVVSSVSIVICNKALMSSLGFNFATTLTSWHLLVTFCSLHVALCMKLFEHKPFDARTVMGFGVLNGISIGLLNLSLGFNSVGFYQMTKLAIIPCTVILETLFFRKKFSRNIKLSLSVLLLGVGVATITDLQLNVVGSVLSLLAIITTCIAQIMTNTIQKKFKVSSTQLLYQSCPYQALTLFLVGPFLDGFLTDQNVFAFDYTTQVLFFIVLSCLISVSVNFSTFLVIGKTSPVTYQVLGHLKTCLVLTFGYVLLHDPFSWRNILGILIAVIGMVLYSYFCTRETQQKPAEVSPQVIQVPVLNASNLGLIKPNTLVRFRGMVQDMLGNEYYIGAFKDGSTWRTNKFTDFSPFSMPHPCDSHLWERHLFHCVPAPGQNSWTLESSPGPDVRRMATCLAPELREKRKRDGDNDGMDVSENGHGESSSPSKKPKEGDVHVSSSSTEEPGTVPEMNGGDHHIPGSSFSCLVKIYDMPDSQVKLNDVIEFIGVYTFDPELAAPSDNPDDIMLDLMEDVTVQLPPSKVPRLHCLVCRKLSSHDFILRPVVESSPNLLRGIRQSLLSHLTLVLGNDELAAQCLLLHLLSRLRSKVDLVTVGRLSLNFTGFNRESASIFGNQLYSLIQKLVPYSQAIRLSIEYLNTATLQPRKDNKSGRLVTGVLQLPQGTHLTFDETLLQTGSLTSKGVENTMLLKNLMESQKVDYDFEYYKLEMAADVQLLTLSEGKSNILPSDLVVPFRPSSVPTVNAGAEETESWRWYLATVRSLAQSTEPETYQMIQDEMVSAMRDDRSLGCSELSRWLTMAQIMASSFGEKSLSLEHWQMVKELERLRKQRMQ